MHLMLPDAMRATPRKCPIIDRFTYLKIEQPEQAKKVGMIRFFRHYRKSLNHVRQVLAAIVQANNNLFQPGPNHHPALIVYDLEGQAKPEDLVQLARRIYQLHSSDPSTEEEQKLADHLNDDYERSSGWAVPSSYTPASCRITTIYIPRKHLPGGHLQDKILPICVDPENGVAAVFPVKYWG